MRSINIIIMIAALFGGWGCWGFEEQGYNGAWQAVVSPNLAINGFRPTTEAAHTGSGSLKLAVGSLTADTAFNFATNSPATVDYRRISAWAMITSVPTDGVARPGLVATDASGRQWRGPTLTIRAADASKWRQLRLDLPAEAVLPVAVGVAVGAYSYDDADYNGTLYVDDVQQWAATND